MSVALVILAPILGDVLLKCVHGPVGSRIRYVHEERIAARAFGMLSHIAHRMVADGIRVIVSLGFVLRIIVRRDIGVASTQGCGIIKTACPGDGAVEPVKAPLQRPVVLGAALADKTRHMPLACHVGAVVGPLENLCDGQAVCVQVTLVGFVTLVVGHVSDARLMLIQPGQE